jgi:restriction endonuclease S subunit
MNIKKPVNKIEKLIDELCPAGVEFRQVGEICQISRGRVMSKDYLKANIGEYPVYSSQTANQGGHNVDEPVIRRRFDKGWNNFHNVYKNLVDAWVLYDNSGESPQLIDEGKNR